MLFQQEIPLNWYWYYIWYLVEHYPLKMFHWYLLVGNFVICFWINLVFKIAFDTCFVFDFICLFWVNSVYLLWGFNRKFFSIGGMSSTPLPDDISSTPARWCVICTPARWHLTELSKHVLPLWSPRSKCKVNQPISLIYLTFWLISLISLTFG